MIELFKNSKTILLPSGRDHQGCAASLESFSSISVPDFPSRKLIAYTAGRRFIKVKSRDIPMLLKEGFADVGVMYTDMCQEIITDEMRLKQVIIGEAHLRFSLLIPREHQAALRRRLSSISSPPVTVATAYPTVLKKYIERSKLAGIACNITAAPIVLGGSLEVAPALGLAEAVADVVNTGETACVNGLVPYHLEDIFPVIVYKANHDVL